MNERMRELAIDAGGHGLKMSTIGLSLLGEQQIEKFAELIVGECMSNLYLNGYDDAMIQIKQHFEIKE